MSTIFDKTVCLTVTFHMPGDSRHGDMGDVETDANKSELALRKRIFRSDSYRECWMIANKTRKWIEKRSVPSPLKAGTYLVPQGLVDEVEEMLGVAQAAFYAEADSFIAEYPFLIKQAEGRLGSQFDPRNYPPVDVMRRRFRVERMFLDFAPARPGGIDQEQELEGALLEIKAALRAGLLELVQKLTNMLGDRKDGKKKGLRDTALTAFTEWMDLLPARLVVDDDELKGLADKAKAIMAGKAVADLRDIESVRSQVRTELANVGEQLKGLLKDMPARAFSFDE